MPAAVSRCCACFVVLLTLISCDRITTVSPSDPPVFPTGDPIQGRVVFQDGCAGCHAGGDGFDIAFFGFGDQRIFDEARIVVDSAAALDVVAYIASLGVTPVRDGPAPFQPGGEVLADDLGFAQRVFGGDHWPEDLSSGDLLALDPLAVPVAVTFPVWSERVSNLHWLPEAPLDPRIADHRNGEVQGLLDEYYRNRSGDALVKAVAALRSADRDADFEASPCVASPLSRLEAGRCFETRRWIASLGAQYMLRTDETGRFDVAVHDSWWDVGNAARLSLRTEEPVEDALESWVQWMYMGWAFEPARHSSSYLASGLAEAGLPRHAAFHALRSMVARGKKSRLPYEDVANAARYVPDAWVHGAVLFGYHHLLDRLDDGDRPKGDARESAVYQTLLSYQIAASRLELLEILHLRALRDEILDRLE